MNAATLTEALRRTGTGQAKLAVCAEFMGPTGERADNSAQELVDYLKTKPGVVFEGTLEKAQAIADGEPYENFIGPAPETGVDSSEERIVRAFGRVMNPEKYEAEEKKRLEATKKAKTHREVMKKDNWEYTATGPEKDKMAWHNKVTGHTLKGEQPVFDEQGHFDEKRLIEPAEDKTKSKVDEKVTAPHAPATHKR